MPKPLKVERADRSVIERKLLTALEDGSGKVAVVCTKDDLDLLIGHLSLGATRPAKVFRDDLIRLKKEAFGA